MQNVKLVAKFNDFCTFSFLKVPTPAEACSGILADNAEQIRFAIRKSFSASAMLYYFWFHRVFTHCRAYNVYYSAVCKVNKWKMWSPVVQVWGRRNRCGTGYWSCSHKGSKRKREKHLVVTETSGRKQKRINVADRLRERDQEKHRLSCCSSNSVI